MEINSDWSRRSCPSCGSNEIEKEPVGQSSRPAEKLSFSEVKKSFVGLRKDQVFFSYFRCATCSLLYCPWYFTQIQLDELYVDMPDNFMGEDKSTVSKTQSGYVIWLGKFVSKVEKYIEIGPDVGLVAKSVIEKFTVKSATMVEPNLAIHEELSYSIDGAKNKSICQDLDQVSNGNFDLVVGVHVYDHLLDPIGDLKKLNSISDPEAKLLIVVHNEKSALRKLLKKKWPPFCLQHPQLYNPTTLGNVLEKAGWKLEVVSKSTNWWRVGHLLGLGLGILGLPSKWTRLLPKFEVPIRLGNIITLAKRNDTTPIQP